jgi:hypothetical protein
VHFSEKDMLFTGYLFTMTDDTGIFQHSIYGIPDPKKGYTTDDNCRALILAVMLYEKFHGKEYLMLINKYLSFMLNAQNENGRFKNFLGYNREFMEEEGSEDCSGRCLWALGRTISSSSITENSKKTCQHMINKVLEHWPVIQSPRAKAYSIVGLSFLGSTEEINSRIEELSMSLVKQYEQYKDGNWHWFENSMTYGNAVLPLSLFKAYKILKKDILLETARESMDFLGSITMKDSFFKPVGCNGWYEKGGQPAEFDEQPVEAFETMLSYLSYYDIVKDEQYLNYAVKCFCWFAGVNSKGLSLIDTDSGACYDGLNKEGINYNQGSESLVSYGISLMEISEHVSVISDLGQWLKKRIY